MALDSICGGLCFCFPCFVLFHNFCCFGCLLFNTFVSFCSDYEEDDKYVQTEIADEWLNKTNIQLGHIEEAETRNQELMDLAKTHEDRLAAVVTENKSLIDEIDFLIKQAVHAQFRQDGGNHTGQAHAMEPSPSEKVATSASDKTILLCEINAKAQNGEKQVVPYAAARMEGTPLSRAFRKNDQYLHIKLVLRCIINMEYDKNDGVETLFRSRETLLWSCTW